MLVQNSGNKIFHLGDQYFFLYSSFYSSTISIIVNQVYFFDQNIYIFNFLAILPGRPHNLTFRFITSKSVAIDWKDPVVATINSISRSRITLHQDENVITNYTKSIGKGKYFILDKLTPFTKYKASIALGNENGFGDHTTVMFTTDETGENKIVKYHDGKLSSCITRIVIIHRALLSLITVNDEFPLDFDMCMISS